MSSNSYSGSSTTDFWGDPVDERAPEPYESSAERQTKPENPDIDSEGDEVGPNPMRSLIEWAMVIVGAFVLAFVVNTFLLQAFWIPSESMVPTLVENDRILVNKIGNRFSDPSRGDLVVFSRPDGAGGSPDDPKDLIKRVVGLPGETVTFENGQVVIDGDPLEENYLVPGTMTETLRSDLTVISLEEDEYLMLGDNRQRSSDSREWGPLPRDKMVGEAFVKFWPLTDLEFF